MATSTVPALRAALLAQLAARAGLAGVQITWGRPPDSLENEWIMLAGTRPGDPTGEYRGGQSSAQLGRRTREERYVLDIVVSVIASIHDAQQGVTERAYELVEEIENQLREDATVNSSLGATGWAQIVDASDLQEPWDKEKREARVTVQIACAARI